MSVTESNVQLKIDNVVVGKVKNKNFIANKIATNNWDNIVGDRLAFKSVVVST